MVSQPHKVCDRQVHDTEIQYFWQPAACGLSLSFCLWNLKHPCLISNATTELIFNGSLMGRNSIQMVEGSHPFDSIDHHMMMLLKKNNICGKKKRDSGH